MNRMMKSLTIVLTAAIGFSLILINIAGAEEYIAGENLTISVTNATDGSVITNAVCNITVSNSSGLQIDGLPMLNGADGTYFWAITAIEDVLTEKYLAKSNCSVAGNEWTVWGHFSVVDEYSGNKIEEIPQDVWENPSRNLTFIQFPLVAPISIDFSASGIFNATFYYTEAGHVLGITEPEIDSGMQSDYYQKIVFDIGSLPINVTNGYLIYWAKKNGNPTGELGITYNGTLETNISVIDVTTLTTDYQKFIIGFDGANITSQYVEIIFKGQAAWNVANNVILGAGELIATNSYGSDDIGASWEHLSNELTVGLVVEYNQTSFLDQLLAGGISTLDREDVWDTSPRNLTFTNHSAVNLTQNALDNIQTHVWAAATRTLTSFGTLIADIWAYAARTLSNWGEVPDMVWNATPHRNLTYTNTSDGGAVTNVFDNSTMNIILPADAI